MDRVECSKCGKPFVPTGEISGKLRCPDCMMKTTRTLRRQEKLSVAPVGNEDPFKTTDSLKATSRLKRESFNKTGRHKATARVQRKAEDVPEQKSETKKAIVPLNMTGKNPMLTRNQADRMALKGIGRYRIEQITRRIKAPRKDHTAFIVAASTIAIAIFLDVVLFASFYFPPLTSDRGEKMPKVQAPRAVTLDDMFRLPDDELNLATVALLVAKEDYERTFHQGLMIENYLYIIDRMAATIQQRIRDDMEPEQVIEAVCHYLYEEEGFVTSQNAWDPANLYLNFILQGKQGYCLGFVELWLALAERIQWRGRPLPIYGVLVPYHIFCRWDDGNYRRNIETLHVPPIDSMTSVLNLVNEWLRNSPAPRKAGRDIPDTFYRTQYEITVESIESGVYLKNMSKKAVIGCIYSNRSSLQLDHLESLHEPKERMAMIARAQQDILLANQWHPQNVLGIRAQAIIYSEYQGEHEKAIELLNRLEKIDPTAETFSLLGIVHTRLGNYEEALECFDRAEKALAFKSATLSRIPYLKANVYYVWGKYDEAEKFGENFLAKNKSKGFQRDWTADIMILSLMVKIYSRHEKYVQARQCAWALQQLRGRQSEEVTIAWGDIHRYRGEWKKAREYYEEVLKWYNPSSATALYGMGAYWKHHKDYGQALGYFQRALMYDRNFPEAQEEMRETERLLLISEKLDHISRICRRQTREVIRCF